MENGITRCLLKSCKCYLFTSPYHDSSPANTPEWQNYDVVGGPNYSYTWCEKILVNECAGPNGSDGAPGVTVWVDAPPTPAPCPTGTPGPDPIKPIPVTDRNGTQIIGGNGGLVFRPDDGHDPQFFLEQGATDGPTMGLLTLPKFQAAHEWDEQRPLSNSGNFNRSLIDYASIAIGLYGCASNISDRTMLLIYQAGAATGMSNWDKIIKRDTMYSRLPRRNVNNVEIGYNLCKLGTFALCH